MRNYIVISTKFKPKKFLYHKNSDILQTIAKCLDLSVDVVEKALNGKVEGNCSEDIAKSIYDVARKLGCTQWK